MEVRTTDGKVLVRQPKSVPGDPHNPVSQELLEAKFRASIARRFVPRRQGAILELFGDQRRLEAMAVDEFVDLFVM